MKYCFLVLILNLVALVLMSNLEIFPKLQVMFLPDVGDDYKTPFMPGCSDSNFTHGLRFSVSALETWSYFVV